MRERERETERQRDREREREREPGRSMLFAIFGRLSLSGELCSFSPCFPTMAMEQDKDYCHDEDSLLLDDIESTNVAEDPEKTKNSSDTLTPMIANMNHTMATIAGNISSMGNALKRMHADTALPSNAKRPKNHDCSP